MHPSYHQLSRCRRFPIYEPFTHNRKYNSMLWYKRQLTAVSYQLKRPLVLISLSLATSEIHRYNSCVECMEVRSIVGLLKNAHSKFCSMSQVHVVHVCITPRRSTYRPRAKNRIALVYPGDIRVTPCIRNTTYVFVFWCLMARLRTHGDLELSIVAACNIGGVRAA